MRPSTRLWCNVGTESTALRRVYTLRGGYWALQIKQNSKVKMYCLVVTSARIIFARSENTPPRHLLDVKFCCDVEWSAFVRRISVLASVTGRHEHSLFMSLKHLVSVIKCLSEVHCHFKCLFFGALSNKRRPIWCLCRSSANFVVAIHRFICAQGVNLGGRWSR